MTFLLAASFAQLTVRIDLVGQIHLEELLLLLGSLKHALNLVESFLGAEVRLVVEVFDSVRLDLGSLLVGNLAAQEVDVVFVLSAARLLLDGIHPVHVVDR